MQNPSHWPCISDEHSQQDDIIAIHVDDLELFRRGMCYCVNAKNRRFYLNLAKTHDATSIANYLMTKMSAEDIRRAIE